MKKTRRVPSHEGRGFCHMKKSPRRRAALFLRTRGRGNAPYPLSEQIQRSLRTQRGGAGGGHGERRSSCERGEGETLLIPCQNRFSAACAPSAAALAATATVSSDFSRQASASATISAAAAEGIEPAE